MSRRIAVDLHDAIVKLRPDWAGTDDDDEEAERGKACVVKVVMTGSAEDGPGSQRRDRCIHRGGLSKPDISILSDQFLAEVRGLKYKNVAAELLEKLLRDELRVRSRRNLVQAQVFSEKLKRTLNGYYNRAISTMEVIDELIKLAKDLDAATKRGEELGLTDDEVAFYDALAANESAVKAMGDEKLRVIAAELITQVKKSVTLNWTLRESARAKIKVMVTRILNKYGYPPDLQNEAVKTVLAPGRVAMR